MQFTKTGEGRVQPKKHVIIHVDEAPCPKREVGGFHFLQVRADGVVACVACKVTWADLDHDLNRSSACPTY